MNSGVANQDIYLAIDERGHLNEWSQRAADHLGGRNGDFEQQDAATLVAPSDRETFTSALDRARETGDAGPYDVTVLTADGTVVHEMNARRVYVSERDVVEVTFTPPNDQDDHQRDRDAEAEFAGIIAHDLRNPLNVIEGRLELARETGDMSHLDRTEEAIDRMERLIDDVLALAQSGEQVTERHEIPLGSLVRDDAWTGFETDGASLEMGDLPTIEGDYDGLCRLFENLFRNAVEHAEGDVQVTVGPLDDGEFYVADDGPGIPPAERERVFEEGYSGGDGTGLGLAIVQQVTRAHGWTVQVTDSEEGGARFEFRVE